MKRISILFFLILAGISLFIGSCNHKDEEKHEGSSRYTCPMHPQVIKGGPGTCPICKMDLVPVKTSAKAQLTLSDSQIELANVKTQIINTGDFTASKILNGRVVANPEASAIISSRYPGRIDRLFVRETGVQVNKGQALYQVYSEELQALQHDYLLQTKQQRAFPNESIYASLKEAAKNKLLLYGFSNAQIRDLEKSGKLNPHITVFATETGVVEEVGVTEGQYIAQGTTVLRLQNLKNVWVEADVYPSEADIVKVGTIVQVSVEGQPQQKASISFISPSLDPGSQVLKARINLTNRGGIQPGMHATISLPTAHISNAVALPVDAVVRDEKGATVWIKTGKETFEPRKVITGQEDENTVIITSGLENVKEVVISGTYLLNSELALKPVL